MHGDPTQFPVVPLPERAARVPLDARNTAPPTRARFAYQDELAALIVLERLASGGMEGVLVERATDLAVIPIEGDPELIAIKHRDQIQRSATYWTVGDLASEVLPDLHRYWVQMGRACTVAFATNAGLNGDAYSLAEACDQGALALRRLAPAIVTHVRNRLKVSKPELEAFLSALTIEGGQPGRDHISATGIRTTAALLELYRAGPITTAQTVYNELCALIEERSTERAPQDDERGLAATLAQTRRNRRAIIENRQYLPAPALLEFVLRVHDRAEIAHLPEREAPAWQADAAFVGRVAALESLDQYLRPGSGDAVPPLVIRGIPGSGKSALALHYAATRSNHFRTVRIDGADRSQIAAALAELRPEPALEAADLPGPVAPTLLQNSALLIIVDDVVDPHILTGLVPATSLCRVLVTANGRSVLPGWNTIDLDTWERGESLAYLRLALPEVDTQAAGRLATALHDHPLGISQATAYIRATGRTVDDYLRRFDAQPGHMLEREPAPGHPAFITTTTELLLTEAEHHTPHALPLARALAQLATVPIAEPQLHVSLQNPALIAPPPPTKAKTKRRWGFGKTRGSQTGAEHDEGAMTVSGADELIAALDDDTNMDDAIDALVRLSLLRRDPGGLSMHPLVALVVRATTPDPSVALALACSWFVDPDDDPNRFESQRLLLPHLHALTSQAVRSGGAYTFGVDTVLCGEGEVSVPLFVVDG